MRFASFYLCGAGGWPKIRGKAYYTIYNNIKQVLSEVAVGEKVEQAARNERQNQTQFDL